MSNLKYVLEHTMLNKNDVISLVLPNGTRVWKGFVKDAYSLSESYSFNRFIKQEIINEDFNKPSEVLEVTEIKKETKKPVKGEYALNNKDDVIKAIKFFNYQKPEHEEDYANAIINKMHEYGIGSDKIDDENRLCKYIDSCTADLSEAMKLSTLFDTIGKWRSVNGQSWNKIFNDTAENPDKKYIPKYQLSSSDIIALNKENKKYYLFYHDWRKSPYCEVIMDTTPNARNKKLSEEIDSDNGHISGSMTAEDIAKKHGVDVKTIDKQVEIGIKVEHEHTNDDNKAKRIALDHLYELPDYYDRLEDMEHEGEKELSEAADSALVKQSQMANGWSMSKQGRYDPEMLTAKGLGAVKSTLGQTIIACIPIIGLPAAIAASIRQNNNLERINSEQYKELRDFVSEDPKCKTILRKIKFELMEPKPSNNKLKEYRKEFFDALKEAKEKYKGTLSEAIIPGEHKCPNCGATLDAWDGTFCDEECKKQYNEKKHSTNEELLTEKPLYTEDGKTEVKRYNGESYKSMKEVNDDRAKQLWTRETDVETGKQIGHGAFAPSGKYADRNDDNPSLVFKAESPISGRMLKKKVDDK